MTSALPQINNNNNDLRASIASMQDGSELPPNTRGQTCATATATGTPTKHQAKKAKKQSLTMYDNDKKFQTDTIMH